MSQAPERPGVSPSTAELAVATRSGFVESRHHGHAVLVGPDGAVEVAVGDPTGQVHPRSSLKPWQALASLRAGAPLAGEHLAIATASHVGSARQLAVVAQVLADAGLGVDALQCPPARPDDDTTRDAWARAGRGPEPLGYNCSGKHAGFLAACVAAGWDPATYLAPDHPLQQAVRAEVEEATGEPVTHVAVDGCGAPLFATSLVGIARAVGALAAAEGDDRATVADAMRAHPWAVHGEGRSDTVVMQALPGVVCKRGAEAVVVLGSADGVGVAVKVLDGGDRAAMLVALHLLATRGVDVASALAAAVPPVRGGGTPVGALEAGAALRAVAG